MHFYFSFVYIVDKVMSFFETSNHSQCSKFSEMQKNMLKIKVVKKTYFVNTKVNLKYYLLGIKWLSLLFELYLALHCL